MTEKFTFTRVGTNNIIDVNITIRANRGRQLKMGHTEEGALGFCFADESREDPCAMLTNSEGVTGRGIRGGGLDSVKIDGFRR